MVWEQGSATIVMLTNLEEKGRVRTPIRDNPSFTYIHISSHSKIYLVAITDFSYINLH